MTDKKKIYKFKSIDGKYIIGTKKDPKNDFFSKYIFPFFTLKKEKREKDE